MQNNVDFHALCSSNSKDGQSLKSGAGTKPVKCTLFPSESSQTACLCSVEVGEQQKKKMYGRRLSAIDKAEKETTLKNEGPPANLQQQVCIRDEKGKAPTLQANNDINFSSRRYCEESSSFVATSDAKFSPAVPTSNTNGNVSELTSGYLFTRQICSTLSSSSLKPLVKISSHTGMPKSAPKTRSSQGDVFFSKGFETNLRAKGNHKLFPLEATEERRGEKITKNAPIKSILSPSVKETLASTDFSTLNEDEKNVKEEKKRTGTGETPEKESISHKSKELSAETSHFFSGNDRRNSKSLSVQSTIEEGCIPLNFPFLHVPLSSTTSIASKSYYFEIPDANECFDRRDTASGVHEAPDSFSGYPKESEKAILPTTPAKSRERTFPIILSSTETKFTEKHKRESLSGKSSSSFGFCRLVGDAKKGSFSMPLFTTLKKRENLGKTLPLPAISHHILEKDNKGDQPLSLRSPSPASAPLAQSTTFHHSGVNEPPQASEEGSSGAVLPCLYGSARTQRKDITGKQEKPLETLISGVLYEDVESTAPSMAPQALSSFLPTRFSSHLTPSSFSRSTVSSPESLQSMFSSCDPVEVLKVFFDLSVLEFDARLFIFRWWFAIFHELSLLEYVNRKLLVKQKGVFGSDAEINPAVRCFPTFEWVECTIGIPHLWIAECYQETLFTVLSPPSSSDEVEENKITNDISSASAGCRTKVFESDSSHSKKHAQKGGHEDLLYVLLTKRCLKYIQLYILEFTATSMASLSDEGRREIVLKSLAPYYAADFRKLKRGVLEEGDDPPGGSEKVDVRNSTGTGIKDTPLTVPKRASVLNISVGNYNEENGATEGILFPTFSATLPPKDNPSIFSSNEKRSHHLFSFSPSSLPLPKGDLSDTKKVTHVGDLLSSTETKVAVLPESTLEAENSVLEKGHRRSPPTVVHVVEAGDEQEKVSRFSRSSGVSSAESRRCDSGERDTGESSVHSPESLNSMIAMKYNGEFDSSRKGQAARIRTPNARKGERREMIAVEDGALSSGKKYGERWCGVLLLPSPWSVKSMWMSCLFILKRLNVYVCAHYSASFWVSSFTNGKALWRIGSTSFHSSSTEVPLAKTITEYTSSTTQGCDENEDCEKEGVPFFGSVKNRVVDVAHKDRTTFGSGRSSRSSKASPLSPTLQAMLMANTRANSTRNESPEGSVEQREGLLRLKTPKLGDTVLSEPFTASPRGHSNSNPVDGTQKNAKEALLHVVNLEATCRESLSNLFLFLLNSMEVISAGQHYVDSSVCKSVEAAVRFPKFYELKALLEEDVKALRQLLVSPFSFSTRTKWKSEDEGVDGHPFFSGRKSSVGRDGALLRRSNNSHWVHVALPHTSKMLNCSSVIVGKPVSVEPKLEMMVDAVSAQRPLCMKSCPSLQGEGRIFPSFNSRAEEAVWPTPSGGEECELLKVSSLPDEPLPHSLSENSSSPYLTSSLPTDGNNPPSSQLLPAVSSGSSFLLTRVEVQHAPRGQKTVSSVAPTGLKSSPNREAKLLEHPSRHSGFSARYTGLEVENNTYDALRWGWTPHAMMHRVGSSLDSLLSLGELPNKTKRGIQLDHHDSFRGSSRPKGKNEATPKGSARSHPSVTLLRSTVIPGDNLASERMEGREVSDNSGGQDHAELSSGTPKEEDKEEMLHMRSTSNVSLCSERFPIQSPSGIQSVLLPLTSGLQVPQNLSNSDGTEMQELQSSFFLTEIIGDEPLDASLSYKSINPSIHLISKVYSTTNGSIASDALIDPFCSSSFYRSNFYSQASNPSHVTPNTKRSPHRFPFSAQKLAPHSSSTTGGMGDSFFPYSSALLASSASTMQSTEFDIQNHLLSSISVLPQSSGHWNSSRMKARVVYGRETTSRGKLLSSSHDTNVSSPLVGLDLDPTFNGSKQ